MRNAFKTIALLFAVVAAPASADLNWMDYGDAVQHARKHNKLMLVSIPNHDIIGFGSYRALTDKTVAATLGKDVVITGYKPNESSDETPYGIRLLAFAPTAECLAKVDIPAQPEHVPARLQAALHTHTLLIEARKSKNTENKIRLLKECYDELSWQAGFRMLNYDDRRILWESREKLMRKIAALDTNNTTGLKKEVAALDQLRQFQSTLAACADHPETLIATVDKLLQESMPANKFYLYKVKGLVQMITAQTPEDLSNSATAVLKAYYAMNEGEKQRAFNSDVSHWAIMQPNAQAHMLQYLKSRIAPQKSK